MQGFDQGFDQAPAGAELSESKGLSILARLIRLPGEPALRPTIHLWRRPMNKVTPFLWFDHEAEEAMNFYVSVFKNSKVVSVNRADGRVMTVNFELDGQPFIALNAGPHFKFNEAVSFFINCDTQEEVDLFWDRLSEGGEKSQCGWLKDRWGLSWQVVPSALTRLIGDPDPVKSKAVLDAMLRMKKIVIADLQQAYDHARPAPV